MAQTNAEHIEGLQLTIKENRTYISELRKEIKGLREEVESWVIVARYWRDKYKNEILERR